jgi:hypothetical protein
MNPNTKRVPLGHDVHIAARIQENAAGHVGARTHQVRNDNALFRAVLRQEGQRGLHAVVMSKEPVRCSICHYSSQRGGLLLSHYV